MGLDPSWSADGLPHAFPQPPEFLRQSRIFDKHRASLREATDIGARCLRRSLGRSIQTGHVGESTAQVAQTTPEVPSSAPIVKVAARASAPPTTTRSIALPRELPPIHAAT